MDLEYLKDASTSSSRKKLFYFKRDRCIQNRKTYHMALILYMSHFSYISVSILISEKNIIDSQRNWEAIMA